MSTYHVCPHLSCLSPPIMSVPIKYVCPHLSCLSPPIILCWSVPNLHFYADKPFLNLECGTSSSACFFRLNQFKTRIFCDPNFLFSLGPKLNTKLAFTATPATTN